MLQRSIVSLPWLIYGLIVFGMAGLYLITAWPAVSALPLIAIALVMGLVGYGVEQFAHRPAFKAFVVVLAVVGALLVLIATFYTPVHLKGVGSSPP